MHQTNPLGDPIRAEQDNCLVEPSRMPLLRKHMPELDVLRGLAILMVVLFHGLFWSTAPTTSIHIVNLVIKATVVGWLGVNLFFVL
jgi:peptidoglycan/LPS O-acetylase OafA/YrhL